jgi:RNA polymerase sigma factor (sigma-70 family)
MNDSQPDDALNAALNRLAVAPTDESAWRVLHRQLWPIVVSITYRRLRNAGAAEDAAQDVFLRLVYSKPYERIRDPSEFRAYVWRVAINCASSIHQNTRRNRAAKNAVSENKSLDPAVDTTPSNEDRLLLEEALNLAQSSLVPLDSKVLTALLEGRNLRETADELGQSYSSVGVRLHRLRKKLYKALEIKDN